MTHTVDFATFCYSGDSHRLHAPGQFKRQVESNRYEFNQLIVVYQKMMDKSLPVLESLGPPITKPIIVDDKHIDHILEKFGIDLSKAQYSSTTDSHHQWKYHVVNHLTATLVSNADYMVFADNDCWIKSQPCFNNSSLYSWIEVGIHILEDMEDVFIVSPNDGENERKTQRMSQQMFLVRTEDFRNMDFNQPGWDGNPFPSGPMMEYYGMLEGRMEIYCRSVNKFRYVLDSKYRYWHHNRLNKDDLFELDYTKY